MPRYIANNRIVGLEPPRRLPDGTLAHHAVESGQLVELSEDVARPLLAGGAIRPEGTLERVSNAFRGR